MTDAATPHFLALAIKESDREILRAPPVHMRLVESRIASMTSTAPAATLRVAASLVRSSRAGESAKPEDAHDAVVSTPEALEITLPLERGRTQPGVEIRRPALDPSPEACSGARRNEPILDTYAQVRPRIITESELLKEY